MNSNKNAHARTPGLERPSDRNEFFASFLSFILLSQEILRWIRNNASDANVAANFSAPFLRHFCVQFRALCSAERARREFNEIIRWMDGNKSSKLRYVLHGEFYFLSFFILSFSFYLRFRSVPRILLSFCARLLLVSVLTSSCSDNMARAKRHLQNAHYLTGQIWRRPNFIHHVCSWFFGRFFFLLFFFA